jgi:hypothetical protein
VSQETSQAAITQDQQVIGTPHYMAPEQVEHLNALTTGPTSIHLAWYFMRCLRANCARQIPPHRKELRWIRGWTRWYWVRWRRNLMIATSRPAK